MKYKFFRLLHTELSKLKKTENYFLKTNKGKISKTVPLLNRCICAVDFLKIPDRAFFRRSDGQRFSRCLAKSTLNNYLLVDISFQILTACLMT